MGGQEPLIDSGSTQEEKRKRKCACDLKTSHKRITESFLHKNSRNVSVPESGQSSHSLAISRSSAQTMTYDT